MSIGLAQKSVGWWIPKEGRLCAVTNTAVPLRDIDLQDSIEFGSFFLQILLGNNPTC